MTTKTADQAAEQNPMTARDWQKRVGLTDADLYAEYAERIEQGGEPEQHHRAIADRAHQFVEQAYVQTLHDLVDAHARELREAEASEPDPPDEYGGPGSDTRWSEGRE